MKRTIVLIVSLVAGLLAAVLTRVYISAKESEVANEKTRLLNKYGTIKVIGFYRNVPAGTVLTMSDVGEKVVPKLGLRGQAVEADSVRDVLGRKLVTSHSKGEVLFWSDLEGGDPASHGLSADVRRQMRAISVNVSGAASVSGMVKPNDHVDVIGTFNFPDGSGNTKKGELVTCTILQNVLVLATGRETAKTQARELGVSSGYSTVTLEVTPREAEMLAFAEQMKGRLLLTLRNRNDTSTEKELPNVDFTKIRSEIEELNMKRQMEKLGGR